ncbi:hypothetical protein QE390_001096 [Siphonobacter sp. SORGH_AS 1065]|nr:hypothetical protein [Siphonobacter sp. SORGH_AS_1065]
MLYTFHFSTLFPINGNIIPQKSDKLGAFGTLCLHFITKQQLDRIIL